MDEITRHVFVVRSGGAPVDSHHRLKLINLYIQPFILFPSLSYDLAIAIIGPLHPEQWYKVT